MKHIDNLNFTQSENATLLLFQKERIDLSCLFRFVLINMCATLITKTLNTNSEQLFIK